MDILVLEDTALIELSDFDLLYSFVPKSKYQHQIDNVTLIDNVNRFLICSVDNKNFRDLVVSMGGIDTAPIWIYQKDCEHRFITSGRYHLDQIRAWLFSITSSS